MAKQKETKKGKVVCGEFRFRFLKQDVSGKGVIPTLLDTLLKARKDTRKVIAKNEEQIVLLKDKEDEWSKKEVERLNEINCYRGQRHRNSLPVHGQRTRTNARARRGAKKTVTGKKK